MKITAIIYMLLLILWPFPATGQTLSLSEEGMSQNEFIKISDPSDGFQQHRGYAALKYFHRIIDEHTNLDDAMRDHGDYCVIFKNDRILRCSDSGVIRVDSTEIGDNGILFIMPIK